MRFGVCYDLNQVGLLEKLGFDYIEGHVTTIAAMSDAEFEALAEKLDASSVKCEACCVLFPGSIKVTGPDYDRRQVTEYLDGVFPRLERLGVKSVVFGSGGARRIPDGWDRAKAWHQLIEVGRILSAKALEHRFDIALEPLNAGETNIINLQTEGMELVTDIDRPGFRILSDYYHLWLGGEGRAEVAACRGWMQHAHISHPVNRGSLAEDDGGDYDAFFGGLKDCGYDGRISYEGKLTDPETELARTLSVMKAAAARAGL
ncbi:MAG: sugar phosphate isomerase/epimerase [Oscillospiraceae bacterium]|nr:sugar phosphate isomerase/epimerase [Oscillospiraceae bacterium]